MTSWFTGIGLDNNGRGSPSKPLPKLLKLSFHKCNWKKKKSNHKVIPCGKIKIFLPTVKFDHLRLTPDWLYSPPSVTTMAEVPPADDGHFKPNKNFRLPELLTWKCRNSYETRTENKFWDTEQAALRTRHTKKWNFILHQNLRKIFLKFIRIKRCLWNQIQLVLK